MEILLSAYERTLYFDKATMLSELDGVWQQVEYYLLNSLHIWADPIIVSFKVLHDKWKIHSTNLSFHSLDADNFWYGLLQIEFGYVFAQDPRINLRQV